ncbi:MAG: Cobalt transport protein [Syntrophorhabdaceae bacterium PtaU1.Bin034]|nr:MAG: Cobalt transport protein [Syntrophorhabdaceae bacterium PtaU1.Bin034]
MKLLSGLDPRTLLLILPVSLTCMILFSHNITRDLAFILYLFILLIASAHIASVIKQVLFLALAHLPLLCFDTPPYQSHFVALAARKGCMIFSTAKIILANISANKCIHVMQKMNISRKIIIPIAVCFRFMPTIKLEAGIILDALKARGLLSLKRCLLNPLLTFEIFLSTCLFRTIALGEELVFSLSTKGLDFNGKYFYRDVGFSYRDFAFGSATALAMLLVIYLPRAVS